MGQSFCTQCGRRLDASGNCTNVQCAAYRQPAAASVVSTAVPTAPPTAPDIFAEAPGHKLPPRSEDDLPSSPSALERDWVAAGEAGQNEVYLGHRLSFQTPELTLNGSPELKLLQMAAARLAVLGVFVFWGSVVIAIIFALVVSTGAGILLFVLINLAFFIAQLLLPTRIPVSEWMMLLDGKGGGAESAFAQITDAFQRRRAPTTPTIRRVSFRGLGGVGAFTSSAPTVRNYLMVRYGHIAGYISVFAFGDDLYLGWTLWWQQRPIRSLWNFIRQTIATMLGRDVHFQLTLRADDAKALRELVHSAAREGIDVATRGLTVSLAGTVGGDVPVEAFQAAFEE
jgi:hypothetical protein